MAATVIPMSPILGKGSMHPFACLLFISGITVTGQYVVEFRGLSYFWGYFIKPCCFSIFNFPYYLVELFLRKLS